MATRIINPVQPQVVVGSSIPSAEGWGSPTVIRRPTQAVAVGGIASAEAFGTPTIAQTAAAGFGTPMIAEAAGAVATSVSEADAALQRRMTREAYVMGAFGVGAVAGDAVDGARGSIIGGLGAAAFAFYRSRPPTT